MQDVVGKYGRTMALDPTDSGTSVVIVTHGHAIGGSITITSCNYDPVPLLQLDSKAVAQAHHESTYYQKYNRRQVPRKMKT
jgi:hypothetical protein